MSWQQNSTLNSNVAVLPEVNNPLTAGSFHESAVHLMLTYPWELLHCLLLPLQEN